MKDNKNLNYYSALKYKIELNYNAGDNTWTASHPELGLGSCYAIGDTQEEAIKKLKEEKEFIIKYALDNNFEIPEPKYSDEDLPSGQFVIRLPRSLHKKLKEEADKEGVSLNQYIVFVLAESAGKVQQGFKYKGFEVSTDIINEASEKYSGVSNVKRKKKK